MAHNSAVLDPEVEAIETFPSLSDLAESGLDERRSCCSTCMSCKMISGRVVCVNQYRQWPDPKIAGYSPVTRLVGGVCSAFQIEKGRAS